MPKNDFKNYRPVSGLNYISKVIERVISVQLKQHLYKHNLVYNFQLAYKAGHSTETALLNIKNDMHVSLSQNEPVALVAAFDTIDHSLLLNQLSSLYGLQIKLLAGSDTIFRTEDNQLK